MQRILLAAALYGLSGCASRLTLASQSDSPAFKPQEKLDKSTQRMYECMALYLQDGAQLSPEQTFRENDVLVSRTKLLHPSCAWPITIDDAFTSTLRTRTYVERLVELHKQVTSYARINQALKAMILIVEEDLTSFRSITHPDLNNNNCYDWWQRYKRVGQELHRLNKTGNNLARGYYSLVDEIIDKNKVNDREFFDTYVATYYRRQHEAAQGLVRFHDSARDTITLYEEVSSQHAKLEKEKALSLGQLLSSAQMKRNMTPSIVTLRQELADLHPKHIP